MSDTRKSVTHMDIKLDTAINSLLDTLGYRSLYPPQELALAKGVLEGRNLLVTTPTASGKTLIAIMATLKIIEKGLKVVYMTPLRALANERYRDFQGIKDSNVAKLNLVLATGDYSSGGNQLASADVIVLTNEKMDTLIRHGAEWLSEVGLFVADEVHLIGDRDRGPTLEMMLTRIRKLYPQSQILALSATISNSDEIANWLGCELVESAWRPTKLLEGVYEGGTIRMNDKNVFDITTSGFPAIDVALDSVLKGGQALIFAETRKRAVSLAAKGAEGVYNLLDKATKRAAKESASNIIRKGSDTDLTKTLSQLVSKGVAFHHAGLEPTSREIVEETFRTGTIKLLAATPTLAAGVNLPARRVVLSSIMRYDSDYGGNAPISILEYKQLSGRAGRPKYDTSGEAIIVASENGASAEQIFDHYILGTPEPIRSQLSQDRAARFHVLSVIATVPGMKKTEICELFESTLFAQQQKSAVVTFKIESAVDFLEKEELIRSRNNRYIATEFGRRASLLYIDPQTAVEFKRGLESIERSATGMHTLGFIHLITSSPNFYPKLSLRKKDFEDLSLIIKNQREELIYPTSEYDASRSLWAIHEWIEERSDRVLLEKIGIEPGDMHRMVEIGDWLAFCLYEVARLLRRDDLLSELYMLRVRIKYGVRGELVPLVALEGVGRVRARALYDAGFADLAKLDRAQEAKLSAVAKIGPVMAKKLKEQLRSRKVW